MLELSMPGCKSSSRAILYGTLSALSYSLNAAIIRHENYLHPGEIATYAFLGTFTFGMPITAFHVCQLPQILGPKDDRLLLLGRAIFNTLDNLLALTCYKYLPVAKSTVIVCSVPAFISVFAKVFLKEPIGRSQIAAAVIAVIGIVVSVDPRQLIASNDEHTRLDTTIGVVSGVGSVIFCCAMMILTRSLKSVHHSVQNTTSSLLGVMVAIVVSMSMGAYSSPRCGYHCISAVAIGVTFYLAQMFLILAFQTDNVSPVAIFICSLEIVLGVLWQAVIFGEAITGFCFGGTALILVAVLLVGIRNWLLAKPEADHLRQKLKCFIE